MSALERSRRLVTTFVALILYSASAWRLRQLNRLMNPKKKKILVSKACQTGPETTSTLDQSIAHSGKHLKEVRAHYKLHIIDIDATCRYSNRK